MQTPYPTSPGAAPQPAPGATAASVADATTGRHSRHTIRVEITAFTMVFAVLVTGAVWMLGKLVPVILVLVAALMLVGTLSPAVRWLEVRRMRRRLAIAAVFVSLLILLALMLTFTIPALISQILGLVEQEPMLRARLVAFLSNYQFTEPLVNGLRNVHYAALIKSSSTEVLSATKSAFAVLAYGAGAFFLALYMMIDRDRLRGALFAVVPRSYHMHLSRILLNLQTIVGGYVRGQAITCLCMGVFLFALLTACRVPDALAYSVFGAVVDVLPFLGIFLTMVPVVLAALAKSQSAAIIVFVLLLCYEEFESRMLIPLVYGRALRLPSSVVFFALLVGGVLYGVVGALIALPLAAALLMVIDELRVDLPGEEHDAESLEQQAMDARTEAEYERRTEGMSAGAAAAVAVRISTARKKDEQELATAAASAEADAEEVEAQAAAEDAEEVKADAAAQAKAEASKVARETHNPG